MVIDESTPNVPTASVAVFADDFRFPLDVEVDPFGQLLVMEYGSYAGDIKGRIFRIAPALPSDVDSDGDVDLHDWAGFQNCFSGESQGPVAIECAALDVDADGDIDLLDYSTWRVQFTGP